jgi:hypothetical protein
MPKIQLSITSTPSTSYPWATGLSPFYVNILWERKAWCYESGQRQYSAPGRLYRPRYRRIRGWTTSPWTTSTRNDGINETLDGMRYRQTPQKHFRVLTPWSICLSFNKRHHYASRQGKDVHKAKTAILWTLQYPTTIISSLIPTTTTNCFSNSWRFPLQSAQARYRFTNHWRTWSSAPY